MLPSSYVMKIATERRGRAVTARGVKWRDVPTGRIHREEARVVVMAGGAVENPRLWLNSGLPNPNDWVGRGFTDRHFDAFTGLFPFETGQTQGPTSTVRCDIPGRGSMQDVGLHPGGQAFAANFSDSGMFGLYDNGAPAGTAGADRVGRAVGNELREVMCHGIDRLLNVAILVAADVESYNRVNLSTIIPPDEHGRVPRVEFLTERRSARTVAKREFLARQAVSLLRKAGATKVFRWNLSQFMLHCTSSMRMGSDASNSVVDPTGEARFVKRLFIGDNSALPNGLGGPNPTLTTQALATRTAENIFTTYFDGDRWVESDAPVASTDPRVTAAVVERGL
jgi:hypothetical protein